MLVNRLNKMASCLVCDVPVVRSENCSFQIPPNEPSAAHQCSQCKVWVCWLCIVKGQKLECPACRKDISEFVGNDVAVIRKAQIDMDTVNPEEFETDDEDDDVFDSGAMPNLNTLLGIGNQNNGTELQELKKKTDYLNTKVQQLSEHLFLHLRHHYNN